MIDSPNSEQQLDQYNHASPSSNTVKTSAPAIPVVNVGDQQSPPAENVTPQAAVQDAQLKKEEKVEYRDQDGNLLNEDEVAALEGKVSFQTRYETRTRVVDEAGNEVDEGPAGGDEGGHAPPHPDVERLPSTGSDEGEDDGREYPATASPEDDVGKERSIEKEDQGKPKPASEGLEATVKDEL